MNTTITFVLLQTSGSDDEMEDEGNKLDLEAARRRIEEQDADDKEVSYPLWLYPQLTLTYSKPLNSKNTCKSLQLLI